MSAEWMVIKMYCPRCGADNSDTRAACWNCFAQLHAVSHNKPQSIEIVKPEAVSKVQPEPVVAPPEVPVKPPPKIEETPPVHSESKVFDLDAASTESAAYIPGLAEILPRAEEETPVAESPPANDLSSEASTDEPPVKIKPSVKAEEDQPAETGSNVVDLDAFGSALQGFDSLDGPKAYDLNEPVDADEKHEQGNKLDQDVAEEQ